MSPEQPTKDQIKTAVHENCVFKAFTRRLMQGRYCIYFALTVMQEEKEKKKNYPLVDLSTMSDGIVGEVGPTFLFYLILLSSTRKEELCLDPVYTKCQRQCRVNTAMTLVTELSLNQWKQIQLLQNGVATHFGVTLLFSMRALSQAPSQCWPWLNADTWCKRALTLKQQNITDVHSKVMTHLCYCRVMVSRGN